MCVCMCTRERERERQRESRVEGGRKRGLRERGKERELTNNIGQQ